MPSQIRKTPLHQWHKSNGANMTAFGLYEMPLWYTSGVKSEHMAVLTGAGMFDTSHMAPLIVSGNDANELLQKCFTRDIKSCIGKNKQPLQPGRSIYGAFLNDKGEVIDDAILYQFRENSYMVVVNSGMGGEIAGHLTGHIKASKVQISDLTDQLGKIDIQGPKTGMILKKILKDPEKILGDMGYFTFKGCFDYNLSSLNKVELADNTPLLLSRTGYTGEFGFEIMTSSDDLLKVWEILHEAGSEYNLLPCGLAARDSLRAGAVLPLSHRDIGKWPFADNPWTFILPCNPEHTGFTKTFIGGQALLDVETQGYTYPFVGDDLRKVATDDPAIVNDPEGNEIGVVLTCVSDMAIGRHDGRIFSVSSPDKPEHFSPKGLCCGFIRVTTPLEIGQVVYLKDKRRKIKVMIADDIRPDRTARRPIREFLTV